MAKCSQCKKSGLTLKVNALGLCRECELLSQISDLQNKINEMSTPEINNYYQLIEQIKKKAAELNTVYNSLVQKKEELSSVEKQIAELKSQVVDLNGVAELQEFGVYIPTFDFLKIDEYKEKLSELRERQKAMIKNNTAVSGVTNWSVNGSTAQGRKMVSDTQKLLLRAFNGECDELVAKVKYNNLDASVKRIEVSCTAISKLGKIMNISISPRYKALKIEELKLAFEYAQAKQKEKEELKAFREQQREEARLQREIEQERAKLTKEQTHYANAIAKLRMQLAEDPDNSDLNSKLEELTAKYEETEKAIKDVDYREANKKAGYVYVISNIGSFGENVYKIGMTRRLDPQDRIDELGDASVPFNFDVHAMIFTDDAPALEAALHNAFAAKKVNLVNHRREFFNVTLDEIKQVIKANFDKTVEFTEIPDAEQFRISNSIRNN